VTIEDNCFGRSLRSIRRQIGLTQEQLAERLAVSPQIVGEWESGRKHPQMERLPQIASALGVEPRDFFPPTADQAEEAVSPEASVEARLARIERQLRRVLEDLQELKGR